MTTATLKLQIEKFANQENITFLKACSAMQAAASKMGNEKMVAVIARIKEESNEYKSLFA